MKKAKTLILTLALTTVVGAAQAQTATTVRDGAYPRHEVSVTGGYGFRSALDYGVLGGDNTLKGGFRAGLGYTWFFRPNWGLGTGLEFARYNNRVALPDGMRYATPSASIEPGTTANFIVNSSGFSEKQSLSMLQIPLTVQWNAPVGSNVRFYALGGGKIGLPMGGSYSQSASSLSTEWLHTTENSGWTQGGLSKNNYSASGDPGAKTAFMLTAELGAKFRVGGDKWLYVGGYVDYGLNDVRKADNTTNLVADTPGANSLGAANSILAMRSATSGARPVAYGLTARFALGWGRKKAAPAPVVAPPPAPAPAPKPEPAPAPAPVKEIPQEIQRVMIDLSDILFAFDRFNLNDAAKAELDKVAAWLTANPDLPVEIGGHTDNYGTDDYNQRLSENRARSVHDYFVGKGVADSRISYRGYGESQPVATNDTPEGRRRNRRVELKIEE